MKIIFMGTPDFAAESLKELYNAGHEIMLVVTNPDRPKGRGMKMVASPVKEFALEQNLQIAQPEKVKGNEEFIKKLADLKPDVICVVAYGKILPKEILEIPKFGCINVHASLLPKYRGAAPIQWAVLNGDETTGVTTMYMDEGMDTGDIILQDKTKIGEDETTGELWSRLAKMGGKLLVKTLFMLENGTAPRIKQSDDFTVAPMLNKQMAKIDWTTQTAKQIKNLVRGLNPIMGAYTIINNKKYKFWDVNAETEKTFLQKHSNLEKNLESYNSGEIIIADSKNGLYIKTNSGILKVNIIQGENGKKMNVSDFLRGNKLI